MTPTPNTDPYMAAKAAAMIRGWVATWAAAWKDYEILDVETEFTFPLLNPETEAASRTFDEGGKIDVRVRHIATGQVKVIEHKTTSDSVAPDSDYWDRLRMDTQCSKYFLANYDTEHGRVASIIYDVLRKPGQRPTTIPELDAEGYKIVLDSAGQRVMTANGKKPRETADPKQGWALKGRPETPAEYEERLYAHMMASPNDYFAQREITRMDRDIIEYMSDAWATSQQILYFRNKSIWPRNPDACDQMGKCEMFDLCCGRASVDNIRFGVREKANPELSIQTSDHGPAGEHELLTNSRMRALRKCARYYKLKYEDKVERLDGDQEALYLGSLVHLGLEQFFLSLKQHKTT